MTAIMTEDHLQILINELLLSKWYQKLGLYETCDIILGIAFNSFNQK